MPIVNTPLTHVIITIIKIIIVETVTVSTHSHEGQTDHLTAKNLRRGGTTAKWVELILQKTVGNFLTSTRSVFFNSRYCEYYAFVNQ